MKKIFLLTITALATIGAFAQEKQNDTLKIKWKNSKIWVFEDPSVVKADTMMPAKSMPTKSDFVHWGGLDLGVSMLTTMDNRFQLPDEDPNAATYLKDVAPTSIENRFALTVGMRRGIFVSTLVVVLIAAAGVGIRLFSPPPK